MPTVKLSSKNQIHLPKAVRRSLGLRASDRLLIEVDETTKQGLLIPVREHPLKGLYGSAKGVYGDPARYLRRLRSEWRKRDLAR